MNIRLNVLALLALTVACGLSGCTSGKRPFLIVQVCLSKAQDLAAFKEEMQSIAHSEGLNLIDDSADAQKDLERIGNPNVARTMHGPPVFMGIERSDGVGLMVDNQGLPVNQVTIGFSEGSNPADAHRFSNEVVERLKQRWHVEGVPPGIGATGMKDCE